MQAPRISQGRDRSRCALALEDLEMGLCAKPGQAGRKCLAQRLRLDTIGENERAFAHTPGILVKAAKYTRALHIAAWPTKDDCLHGWLPDRVLNAGWRKYGAMA